MYPVIVPSPIGHRGILPFKPSDRIRVRPSQQGNPAEERDGVAARRKRRKEGPRSWPRQRRVAAAALSVLALAPLPGPGGRGGLRPGAAPGETRRRVCPCRQLRGRPSRSLPPGRAPLAAPLPPPALQGAACCDEEEGEKEDPKLRPRSRTTGGPTSWRPSGRSAILTPTRTSSPWATSPPSRWGDSDRGRRLRDQKFRPSCAWG